MITIQLRENIFILTAVLLLFAGCSSSNKNTDLVEKAEFVTLEGETVSVSDYKGKVILIDFWETWCSPCLESFKTIQQLTEEYPDRFVVLAVTPGFADTKEDAREFVAEHNYDFVFLFDEQNVSEKLKVPGLPYKIYLDANGEYLKSEMGSYGPEGDYDRTKQIIEEHS